MSHKYEVFDEVGHAGYMSQDPATNPTSGMIVGKVWMGDEGEPVALTCADQILPDVDPAYLIIWDYRGAGSMMEFDGVKYNGFECEGQLVALY